MANELIQTVHGVTYPVVTNWMGSKTATTPSAASASMLGKSEPSSKADQHPADLRSQDDR
ncbi:MAG: hypothetical protein AAGA03_14140 [Planctomycetota bacterium]